MPTGSSAGKALHTCNICTKAYSRKEHLARHHATKHGPAQSFECDACQRNFTRRDILQRHQRSHHGSAKRSLKKEKPPATLDAPSDTASTTFDWSPSSANKELAIDVAQWDDHTSCSSSVKTSALLPDVTTSSLQTSMDPAQGSLPSPLFEDGLDLSSALQLHAGIMTPSYDMIYAPESNQNAWLDLISKLTPLVEPSISEAGTRDSDPAEGPQQPTSVPATIHQTVPNMSAQQDQQVPFGAQYPQNGLSVNDYQRCLFGLYQAPSLPSIVPLSEIGGFPTHDEMTGYIQTFFDRFDPIYPMIHRTSFDINSTPWGLILAIAGFGARYEQDPRPFVAKSAALIAAAKRTLDCAAQEKFSVTRELWFHQAYHLINLTSMAALSSDQFDAGQMGQRISILMCQRHRWLSDQPVDERAESLLPLREQWHRWVVREERKRLGVSIFALEAISCMIWGSSTSDIFQEVAVAKSPCSPELWQAPDENAWAAARKQNVDTSHIRFGELFRRSCNQSMRPEFQPEFKNHFTLLNVLYFVNVFAAKAKSTFALTKTIFNPSAGQLIPKGGTLSAEQWQELENCRAFFERITTLRAGTFQSFEDTLVARYMCLAGMTDHLPAAFFQSYAKQSTHSNTLLCPPIVKEWITTMNGARARETVFYASQVYRLFSVNSFDKDIMNSNNVMNCFSLFYAALTLTLYCRFQTPHIVSQHEPQITLNGYCRATREDPETQVWIEKDIGSVSLDGVGCINPPTNYDRLIVAQRVLHVFSRALSFSLNAAMASELRMVLLHLKEVCENDLRAFSQQ